MLSILMNSGVGLAKKVFKLNVAHVKALASLAVIYAIVEGILCVKMYRILLMRLMKILSNLVLIFMILENLTTGLTVTSNSI